MPTDDNASIERPTRVRWMIFVLICATSWLLYLHRYAWGIVKPAFRAENPELSDIDIGWLDSAFLATYALGQIPTGIAADRFGPRITLTLFTFAWSLAVGGVAWTSGFTRPVLARGVLGLAQAGVYPVLNKMTRIWFPLATRTSVQGIVTAMGRVGGAFASVFIATLLMGVLGLSWENALWVITIPGLVLGVAVWLIVRDSPAEHPWANEAECALLDPDKQELPPASQERKRLEGDVGVPKGVAKNATGIRAGDPEITVIPSPPAPLPEGEGRSKASDGEPGLPPKAPNLDVKKKLTLNLTFGSLFSLAMMFLYIFASTFQDQFYVYWLPSFLREGKGFDNETMGLLAPWPLLGGALGGVIGGFLNDYMIRALGNRRWGRSLVAFTGKFMAALLVIASMQFEDGRVVMLVLVAVRVFSDWSLPTQWAAVTDVGGRAAATVFGIVNTVGALGGVAAGPLFGYLKQEFGWDGIFYGVAGMCVFAATTWLFIDCTKKVVDD